MTNITAVHDDITCIAVDAIVNAANSSLLSGGGVDGAIHAKAGPELMRACRSLNGCRTGEAKMTPGFNLPARHVIHTVGPVWRGGGQGEDGLLAQCYSNSLDLAARHHLTSIAFPAISTGAYGYPMDRAAEIAVRTVREFARRQTSLEEVIFVLFSASDLEIYRRLLEAH